MTNPRRDHCVRGENPSNPISGPSMQLLPPIQYRRQTNFPVRRLAQQGLITEE
jgi:hypothetical protein